MKATLTLIGLDTENGWVDSHSVEMEVESMQEAEDNDNYYEVAMEWVSADLECEVYSYEYYEWSEVENDVLEA